MPIHHNYYYYFGTLHNLNNLTSVFLIASSLHLIIHKNLLIQKCSNSKFIFSINEAVKRTWHEIKCGELSHSWKSSRLEWDFYSKLWMWDITKPGSSVYLRVHAGASVVHVHFTRDLKHFFWHEQPAPMHMCSWCEILILVMCMPA